MVHKDQQRGAKHLSRRALLKGVSMGAGLVAFGGLVSGCTQFLSRSEQSAPLAPAKAGGVAEREVTQRAYEAKEAWKEVLRDYYRWQATGDTKIKLALSAKVRRARIVSITMVDALDAEGFTSKLDEEITRMNFSNISEAEKSESVKATMQELYKAGLPEDMAAAWEQALMEAHPEAGKENILAYRSTGRYLRAQIEEASEAFEELAANQVLRLAWSSSLRQFRPLAACWWDITFGCIVAVLGNLLLLAQGSATGNETAKKAGLYGFASSAVVCAWIKTRYCPTKKPKK